MEWAADASAKFNEMLNDVPAMFRGMAQSMASSAAERIADGRGAVEVDFDDMIRGFIKATPTNFRDGLKQLFQGHGVDLEKYRLDFEKSMD